MKIKAFNFSSNGTLRGNLALLDDRNIPLGWEQRGDWSSPTFQDKAAQSLAKRAGISIEEAEDLLAKALAEARRLAGFPDANPGSPSHSLSVVAVAGTYLRDIADSCWALLSRETTFYAVGDSLSRLRGDSAPRIVPMSIHALRDHLERAADFVKYQNGEDSPSKLPRDVLDMMFATPDAHLPPLEGIAATPVLAGDRLVYDGGYDATLKMYIHLGVTIPPVPGSPSPQDVVEAKRLLLDETFGEFPFVDEAGRAHTLAACLLPTVRPAIEGPTPSHLADAPIEGTGKGLWATTISRITTGTDPPAMTEGGNEEEWRKRITSRLREAPAVILLDNIRTRLDSAALSSVLTTIHWTDRLLGSSRNLTLPVRCLWLATGNNVAASGELRRRTVRVRLDPQMAEPWLRTGFHHDPLEDWVLENRGLLLWALLVLVQNWLSLRRPKSTKRLGGFEKWSASVGGILEAAVIPGFLDSMREDWAGTALGEEEDPDWPVFLPVWWDAFKGGVVLVNQLFALAVTERLLMKMRGGRGARGAESAMGRALHRLRDRVIGGFAIRVKGTVAGRTEYYLESIGLPKSPPSPPVFTAKPPTSPTSPTESPLSAPAISDGLGGLFPQPFPAPESPPTAFRCSVCDFEDPMPPVCPDCQTPTCVSCGTCQCHEKGVTP